MALFETPDTLDNQEIATLTKEAEAQTLSDTMQTQLKDSNKYALFLAEYKNYLERSRNETLKKVISKLFDTILNKFNIGIGSMEQNAETILDPETTTNLTDNQNDNPGVPLAKKTFLNTTDPLPSFPSTPETTEKLTLSETIKMPALIKDGLSFVKERGKELIEQLGRLPKDLVDKNMMSQEGLENTDVKNGLALLHSGLVEEIYTGIDTIYTNLKNKPPVITAENVNDPKTKEQFVNFVKEIMIETMMLVSDLLTEKIKQYKGKDSPETQNIYTSLLAMQSQLQTEFKNKGILEHTKEIYDNTNPDTKKFNEEIGKGYDKMITFYSYIKGNIPKLAGQKIGAFQKNVGNVNTTNFNMLGYHKEEVRDIFDHIGTIQYPNNILGDKMFLKSSSLPFNKEGKRTKETLNDNISYRFAKQRTNSILSDSPYKRSLYENIIERVSITPSERQLLRLDAHGKYISLTIQETGNGEQEYGQGNYQEYKIFDGQSKPYIQTMQQEIKDLDLTF